MDKISYPNSVSIIFTDSIPIFAVLFKIFSPVLPDTFQYFGLYELICFILQAIFAVKLLYFFTNNKVISLCGSLFFIVSPIFITRVFFHTALSSQWLILLALYVGLKSIDIKDHTKLYTYWIIIGLLCASIHLYYIPMCGIIMLGFLIIRAINKKSIMDLMITTGLYCLSGALIVYIMGGFSHDHQYDAGGLGQFSFNMNGFFNSMGWSKILPPLSSYGEGSSDGFSYLGFGILLLLLIVFVSSVYELIKNKKINSNKNIWWACIIICVISILVSASHKFAFNANYMFEIPYPQKLVSLWGMFRSSGRFIWPVVYIIMLYVIIKFSRLLALINKNTFIASFSLLFVFLIQIYDISLVLLTKHNDFNNKTTYQSPLQNENWNDIAENKDHIIFVSRVNQNQGLLFSISQFAYNNNLTINDFYFSHSAIDGEINKAKDKNMENLQDNVIYIFKPEDKELCKKYSLNYYLMDDIIVGLNKKEPKLDSMILK